MRKIAIIPICILLCIGSIRGQKFGKFDNALLSLKTHADTSADAFYDLHNGSVTFEVIDRDAEFIIKVHDRIKVLTEDGLAYGDYSIPYYVTKGGTAEKVMQIKASTFNLLQGRRVEMKVDKKNIFDEKTTDNWRQKKFSFPNVQKGSVLEVTYLIRSPYIHQMPRWFFQKEIPVDNTEYQVVFNDFFRYTPAPKGPRFYEEDFVEFSNASMDKQYSYSASNVPAFNRDEFILSERDYMSSIRFELHSLNIRGYVNKNYSSSWKDIGENLLENANFGHQLSLRLSDFDFLIEEASGKSDMEKARFIYDYVKNNFTTEQGNAVYCSTGLNKIFRSKQGNVADINLLLVSLLRKSNIDVEPFITKNRNSGLFNSNYPSISELNYVLARVKIGEEHYLLDASKKSVPMMLLPLDAVNYAGLEVVRSNSTILNTGNPNLSKYSINTDYVFDSEANELKGTGLATYKDYAAVLYRDQFGMGSDRSAGEDEEENSSSLNTINYNEITGVENANDPIKVRFDEILKEEIVQIENEYLIDATLDFGYEENPFYEDQRDYPVFYSYLKDETHIISIELENNVSLKSKPESMVVKMPNNEASFMYDVKTIGNKLMIYHIFKINQDYVLPENYPDLKAFYDLVVKKSKEKIVLVKN